MTTFDFQDGDGPVPAHRHSNGGGWVANTANVADTAYVGPDARVYGDARVYSNVRVYGDAVISGTLLTANRSDDYTFAIFKCQDGQTRITASCRYFTIPEAINHWTNTRGGTRLGDESIQLVKHLEIMFNLQEQQYDN